MATRIQVDWNDPFLSKWEESFWGDVDKGQFEPQHFVAFIVFPIWLLLRDRTNESRHISRRIARIIWHRLCDTQKIEKVLSRLDKLVPDYLLSDKHSPFYAIFSLTAKVIKRGKQSNFLSSDGKVSFSDWFDAGTGEVEALQSFSMSLDIMYLTGELDRMMTGDPPTPVYSVAK